MRDLVVREALRAMARESAKRLREIVANGAEIPYDIDEGGSSSPLCQYKPLTDRFIGAHADALRALDSFGAACAAIESAGLAGPYLEEMGVNVPADPRRRGELAGIAFLCRLWMDSTDFSLEREPLEQAISELDAPTEATEGEIEVVVPLRGLQLPVERLEMATAAIVRADTVEVPAETRAFDGAGAAGWEPTFLAVCRVAAEPGDDARGEDAGARAVESFRTLITTLRLFKPGGVALGSHAWTRSGGGRWRKVATGCGRPRPGGYRLAETELTDLAAFSRALGARRAAFRAADGAAGPLARAVSRFEAGIERHAVVEALNDYLLSLRFLLEGGGPAELGLPMRVAALVAEPEQRDSVKALLDRAVALERELWSGEPAPIGDRTPAQIAAQVEDLARAILKDAACGHLGGDLRTTADEILLADGLAAGEGDGADRGETAEWGDLDTDGEIAIPEGFEMNPEAGAPDAEPSEAVAVAEPAADATAETGEISWIERKGSRPAPRIQVHMAPDFERARTHAEPAPAQLAIAEPQPESEPERPGGEPSGGRSPVAELLEIHSRERREHADRISNLFPRPETTEWNVRELSYERRARASS